VTCSNGTGSGVLVPETGIHLNNMLGEEDLVVISPTDPEAMSRYGVGEGTLNAFARTIEAAIHELAPRYDSARKSAAVRPSSVAAS
jgi:hypothetical protein